MESLARIEEGAQGGALLERVTTIWQLLVNAATVAASTPVVPVLICPHNAYSTLQMAREVGFLIMFYGRQLFHPDHVDIDADLFDEVADEFGLHVERHTGPYDPIVKAAAAFRRSEPSGPDEPAPLYRRQASRFAKSGPVILEHCSLAQDLDPASRRSTFARFKTQLRQTCTWNPEAKW